MVQKLHPNGNSRIRRSISYNKKFRTIKVEKMFVLLSLASSFAFLKQYISNQYISKSSILCYFEEFGSDWKVFPNTFQSFQILWFFGSELFDTPHFPGVAAAARSLKCCDITSLVSAQRRHHGPQPTLAHFHKNSSNN